MYLHLIHRCLQATPLPHRYTNDLFSPGARMKGILFDFFGTLVTYSTSRIDQGYHQTHKLLIDHDVHLSYDEFLKEWVESHEFWDHHTAITGKEYAMLDVAVRFLSRVAPQHRTDRLSANLWRSYINEWSKGIRYIPGVPELLESLSKNYKIGVVSNTQTADLIHEHLKIGGMAPFMEVVVTSVEHGRPKPHPSIFETATTKLGCSPADTLFVGDSYQADYLGAQQAGLRALLIAPPGSTQASHDETISSVLEVANILKVPVTSRNGVVTLEE